MRLPYVPNPPRNLTRSGGDILQQVLARRGDRGLLALDLTLLHSPTITAGWHTFFATIHENSSLRADLREIAICRAALMNKAWYAWEGHLAALSACEGFGQEKLGVVEMETPVARGALSDQQWLVLIYADVMTRDVRVDDGLFEELKAAGFTDKQIVELTVVIAAYNCVSRFLVALDVGERNIADVEMRVCFVSRRRRHLIADQKPGFVSNLGCQLLAGKPPRPLPMYSFHSFPSTNEEKISLTMGDCKHFQTFCVYF